LDASTNGPGRPRAVEYAAHAAGVVDPADARRRYEQAEATRRLLEAGRRVHAHDQANVGTVVALDDGHGSATVRFVAPTGASAERNLPWYQLTVIDHPTPVTLTGDAETLLTASAGRLAAAETAWTVELARHGVTPGDVDRLSQAVDRRTTRLARAPPFTTTPSPGSPPGATATTSPTTPPAKTVTVDRQWQQASGTQPGGFTPPKTESSTRVIPADGWVLDRVAHHLQRYGEGQHGVVIHQHRHPMDAAKFGHYVRAARTRAGLPTTASFHDLRHFFARALINAGCSVKQVQLPSATNPPRSPSTSTDISGPAKRTASAMPSVASSGQRQPPPPSGTEECPRWAMARASPKDIPRRTTTDDAGVAKQGSNPPRQVRVEQQRHAKCRSGSSRSWTAAAAYSRAARMSASSSSGKSSRSSAYERPAACWPITVLTGIRRSRMHGRPPIFWGSTLIRSNRIRVA
jgi:hypothetical protein